jgi:hypothetical protein
MTPQSMTALERANEIRIARAKDKRELAGSRLKPSVVLNDPLPAHWSNAKIIDLMVSVPRVGRVKSAQWLRTNRISATRKLRELTPDQRVKLAEALDSYGYRDFR